MDLSDGSDAGEELDYDLDENDILGGSDDEERTNNVGSDDQHGENERYEDADYLDLATTGEFEEELNPANDSSTRNVAPVKVRNIVNEPTQPSVQPESEDAATGDDDDNTDDPPYDSSADTSHLLDDDEDADEVKSERSRFHNERQPTQPHHSAVATGSPIRSLGAKSAGHGMRGNGPYAGPRGYRGQGQYPRHFMRGPPFMNQRPGLMRPPFPPFFMNRMSRMRGPPIYQLHEDIFTDFDGPRMMKQMPHLLPQQARFRPNRFPPTPHRQPFVRQNNPNTNTNLKQVGLPPPNESCSKKVEVVPNPSAANDANQTHQAGMTEPVHPAAPFQTLKARSNSGAMSNSNEVSGISKDNSQPAVIIPRSETVPQKSNEATIYVVNRSPPKHYYVQRPRFPEYTSVNHEFQNIPTRCPAPPLTIISHQPFPHQFQGPHAQQVQSGDPNPSNQNFMPSQAQFLTPAPAPQPNWQPQPQHMAGPPPMDMPFNPPFPPQMQRPEYMSQPQPMNMQQPQLSQPMTSFGPPNQFFPRPPYIEPQYNHHGPAPVASTPYVNANPFEFQDRQQSQQPSQYLNQQQVSYQDPHLYQQTVFHYPPQPNLPLRSAEHREIFRRDERTPLKRRIHEERDDVSREYRKSRLQDRLGPPPKSRSQPKHNQEEIEKIIEETKKELGLGEEDEYLRKIEEQKRKREEILRQKEARRKGVSKESSLTLADKKPRLAPSAAVPSKHSVYLNPKTFNGDLLSALDDKLKKINMSIVPSSVSKNKVYIRNQTPDNESVKEKPSTIASSGSGPKDESKPPVKKGKTILRVVRNKKGEIISKSKVVVMKSQHISK